MSSRHVAVPDWCAPGYPSDAFLALPETRAAVRAIKSRLRPVLDAIEERLAAEALADMSQVPASASQARGAAGGEEAAK